MPTDHNFDQYKGMQGLQRGHSAEQILVNYRSKGNDVMMPIMQNKGQITSMQSGENNTDLQSLYSIE